MVKAKKINVDKLQPFVESLKAYLDSESINIQDNNVENAQKTQSTLIKYLKFCSSFIKRFLDYGEDALKLCQSIMVMMKRQQMILDRNMKSKLLMTCATVMVFNKDENTVRMSCLVLNEVLNHISDNDLQEIILKYISTLPTILKKIFKVKTYLTQAFVLEVFFKLTRNQEKLRIETFKKQNFYLRASESERKRIMKEFLAFDFKDIYNSPRSFLVFANYNVVKECFIFSCKGYVGGLNSELVKKTPYLTVFDFNGPQRTVSFYAPLKTICQLLPKTSPQYSKQKDLAYFEMGYDEVEAKFTNDKKKVIIKLTISDTMYTLNFKEPLKKIEGVENICFSLNEENEILTSFMDNFYPNMTNDFFQKFSDGNQSIMEKQSNVSINSLNASILKMFAEDETLKESPLLNSILKMFAEDETLKESPLLKDSMMSIIDPDTVDKPRNDSNPSRDKKSENSESMRNMRSRSMSNFPQSKTPASKKPATKASMMSMADLVAVNKPQIKKTSEPSKLKGNPSLSHIQYSSNSFTKEPVTKSSMMSNAEPEAHGSETCEIEKPKGKSAATKSKKKITEKDESMESIIEFDNTEDPQITTKPLEPSKKSSAKENQAKNNKANVPKKAAQKQKKPVPAEIPTTKNLSVYDNPDDGDDSPLPSYKKFATKNRALRVKDRKNYQESSSGDISEDEIYNCFVKEIESENVPKPRKRKNQEIENKPVVKRKKLSIGYTSPHIGIIKLSDLPNANDVGDYLKRGYELALIPINN